MKTLLIVSFLAVTMFATTAYAGPNCTCRMGGKNYKIGEIMCVRGKLSQCGYVLNNTAWKTIAPTCPQARNYSLKPQTKTAMLQTVWK